MSIKKSIVRYCKQPGFLEKFKVMALGVFFMGFFLSFLIEVNLGTDPCTFMNVTISEKLGILFGTWQLLLNAVLFVFVLLFDRHQIGPGTIANMVFIGYISDFCRWIWKRTIPEFVFKEEPYRVLIFAVALLCFVITASLYMNADMGVSPYDAMPNILSERIFKDVPFKFVRIGFDGLVVLIGVLLGGRIEPCTILMVFLLGPTITTVGGFLHQRVFSVV
ncbi:YczE/YyaS/YitT family protein [Butyrivibrio sp. VCD2006]|uniref:YczE/YyaS/YitT family protein n=1 Tax=Butyrivibrio sp. VCD2006 TaxID=1280664 RepID=UPI00040398B5|nr:membrane protein [Butyrivibrio sp. VCD2006]